MPKLSLPPLAGMPPSVQSAFRAVASWAASVEQSTMQNTAGKVTERAVIVRDRQSSGTPKADLGSSVKVSNPPITSDVVVRAILQNSSMNAPIVMNSSVVFRAGTSQTGVAIGSGGMGGTNAGEVTWAVSSADGSFFFGKEDSGFPSDPAHKQIIFDATTGVFQLGRDIIVQSSLGDVSPNTMITNTDTALSGLADKLDNNAATIMASAFVLKTPSYDSTSAGTGGMALYDGGIIARKRNAANTGWDNTLTIDTGGNIALAGNISGSTGTFAGDVSTSGHIIATGNVEIGGLYGTIIVKPLVDDGLYHGITVVTVGATGGIRASSETTAISGFSADGSGVHGTTESSGFGSVAGVTAQSTGTAPGLFASNTSTGPTIAIEGNGILKWGGYSIAKPVGSTSSFLRNDGSWSGIGTVSDSNGLGGKSASQYPYYDSISESAGPYTATHRIAAVWNGVNIWVLGQAR